jgi:hypothetical protein
METRLQDHSHKTAWWPRITLGRGLGWGLIGGLLGTLVMDLALVCSFAAAGLPVLTCFAMVGDTVARFFSIASIGGDAVVRLGVAAHYLIGPGMGTLFGAAAVRIDALRIDSLTKWIGLAVVYVEVLSQPLLALGAILLRMTAQEAFVWYAGAFGMHFIVGAVLGIIVYWKLRPVAAVNRRR